MQLNYATTAAEGVSQYVATPGLLGFALFAFLGVAVFLLARSMRKHLRRIDVDAHASRHSGRDQT